MKSKRRLPVKGAPAATHPTLLIAAGGTGGHITPGISIAEAWLKGGGRVVFATLIKNLEYPDIIRLARDERVSIVAYDAPRIPKNPLRFVSFLKRFLSAYRFVQRAAQAEQVRAVLGMGGYSSFPAVFFAIVSRVPLYLCEQNARWGIVTRLTRIFSKRIFLSFAPQKKLPGKYLVTGNPVRAMFGKIAVKKTVAARNKSTRLLFLGGSQGASDLNQLYLTFCRQPLAKQIHCTVATGPAAFADVKGRARKSDVIMPFIEDMPAAYLAASAIVARCGSGTLFEILWSGKPAFLIPFPFATANHQLANALALRSQLPCTISDHRPFDVGAATAELSAFVKNPPTPVYTAPGTPAELQIVRYLEQDLIHESNHKIH